MPVKIQIADYDPAWPELFEREAAEIRALLGERVKLLEHAGSTAVPGLAAKPIIDILLVVADSADEQAYAPALEAAGYALTIREPHWHEHRMFKGSGTDVNLHVFSIGCREVDRMLTFRNWLRGNSADRMSYEMLKRGFAAMEWDSVQYYADAKTEAINEIVERAQRQNAARGEPSSSSESSQAFS